jgi:hypothetical protein
MKEIRIPYGVLSSFKTTDEMEFYVLNLLRRNGFKLEETVTTYEDVSNNQLVILQNEEVTE